MQTPSFAVNLTNRARDETTLTWEHRVRIRAVRAFLVRDLVGEGDAWIHVDAAGERLSLLFVPPCGEGSRRVYTFFSGQTVEVPAREPVKVWGIRAATGGVFRVEIDVEAVRPPKARRTRQEPRRARLPAGAGSW